MMDVSDNFKFQLGGVYFKFYINFTELKLDFNWFINTSMI